MTIQRFLIVLMKWLAAFALAAGIVMLIRLFCIESYRISTDSMEEALHKGDYILVNKIPGKNKPVRGKVVLFTSPLSRDSADAPLFISRCIGMPGDTIRVSMDGYTINGHKIPRSPRSLCSCGRRMVKLPSVTESYIWTGGRLISSFSNKTTIGYCPIIPTRR